MQETDKTRLAHLFKQLAANKISPDEYVELIDCLKKADADSDYYKAMDEVWKDIETFSLHADQDKENVYQKIVSHSEFQRTKSSSFKNFNRKNRLLWFGNAAAILVCVIGLSIYYHLDKSADNKNIVSNQVIQHDISPGGNKATLTLADGSMVLLDDVESGQITEQLGISISKTADGQIVYKDNSEQRVLDSPSINTIATPRGGQYQVVLSDGTKVWLNAASSLRYPSKFSQNERKVELVGEAYFEVSKSEVPFYVLSAGQKVQVLGTHFNVNSYVDEHATKTTLLEGSVRVVPLTLSERDLTSTYILKPGQEATFQNNRVEIAKADLETVMAWKNNDFVFKNETIESIMRKISRWYDIEVEYRGEGDGIRFGGFVSRNRNISAVLTMLESTGHVRFNVEGRRVIVML